VSPLGYWQEHQAQLDALAAAHCREIIVETATTRGDRPKLREALAKLQAGDTLVIYKPDRIARSMKELLVLLEDQLHARGINLHILTGICAGIHRPDGATIADKMLTGGSLRWRGWRCPTRDPRWGLRQMRAPLGGRDAVWVTYSAPAPETPRPTAELEDGRQHDGGPSHPLMARLEER